MNSSVLASTYPLLLHRKFFSPPSTPSSLSHSNSKSFLCLSSAAGADREESRWLREEERWQREEQRWLREEQRWLRERDSLLRQISQLNLRIQTLERQSGLQGASTSDTISSIAAHLQVLKERSLIVERGESTTDLVLEEKEKKVVVEEGIRVLGTPQREDAGNTKRKRLRVGSEGEEVREMQEALETLGFYSGEEDMEFAGFSTGTERAVKTWQASVGVPENGVMTAELLEILYLENQVETSDSTKGGKKGDIPTSKEEESGVNGSAVALPTETLEMEDLSRPRVFLLGENRWEEPSRLAGGNQHVGSKTRNVRTRCLSCRGEGRLMCTECDGSGEANIEPQFLEWVGEEAKCPYCEGLGYTACDVCDGKSLIQELLRSKITDNMLDLELLQQIYHLHTVVRS